MAITGSEPVFIRVDTSDGNRLIWRKTYSFQSPSLIDQFVKFDLDLNSTDVQRIDKFSGYLKVDDDTILNLNTQLSPDSYIISEVIDDTANEFLVFEILISDTEWTEKEIFLTLDYTLVNEENATPPGGDVDPEVIPIGTVDEPEIIEIPLPYVANTPVIVKSYDIKKNTLLVFLNGTLTTDFKYLDSTNISFKDDIGEENESVTALILKLNTPDETRVYDT